MTATVRIPADIDQQDKLLAGLTARQLVILAIPTVALWVLYTATRRLIPLMVFAPFAIIVAGVVGTMIVTKRDGVSLDRFVIAAVRHGRAPKRFVPTTDDSIALPSSIAALSLPLYGIDASGVIDLGVDGAAILLEVRAIDLSLQSEQEQQATTAAFGRFCNSLAGSLQIVVHSEPADLADAARKLDERAPSLPALGLERAARDHAAFLRSLGGRHDVLRRRVLMVLRDPRTIETSAAFLRRRADDAVTALRPAGMDLAVLDGAKAVEAVQRACAPGGPLRPLTNDIVRGA